MRIVNVNHYRVPIKERSFIIEYRSDRSMRIELTSRTPTPFRSKSLTSPSNKPSTSTCKLVTNNNNHLFIMN